MTKARHRSPRLTYPVLPPGHFYRKRGEKLHFTGYVTGRYEEVDIFLEGARDTKNYWDALMHMRAVVNTKEMCGRASWEGKERFRQTFPTAQEALNVVVARLWLGLDKGEE